MKELEQEAWRSEMQTKENAVILDVRTQEECAEGIVPGAVQLNIMDSAAFVAGLENLDKSKSYFVYCRAGGRSAQACMIMDSKGFAETFNLKGGFSEWDGEQSMP